MSFAIPVAEQTFLLDHVADLPALIASGRWPDLSADVVAAIVEGGAAFAESEYAPLNRIGDSQGAQWHDGKVMMPAGFRDAYQAFVANGWGTLSGAVEHGGQGLPATLALVMMENLGTANMGFSLINMLTPGAVEALSAHGSADQQARWLPKLITGEWSGTMNLTESQAGSDVGALISRVRTTDNGLYAIKGQKIFITFGDHDLTDNIVHLVLARTPGAPAGPKGISLFLVPKFWPDADGNPTQDNDVRCVSIEHKLGIHASPTCVMVFGDEDRCLGELVGAENGGLAAMFTMMNNARLNVASQGVQIGERAMQQAVAFAAERVQSARADGSSGRSPVPIIEHPDVQRMLLRMKALVQAARALTYYAAGQIDRGHQGDAQAASRAALLIPLAKAYCTDIGCEVASIGIQVHGGVGYVEETGAAQHLRDARIAPIYEGTNGIQAIDFVSRKLMADNGAAMAALIADIRADRAVTPTLLALADAVEACVAKALAAETNARLSVAYPLLTMSAVMVCGWLMARQTSAAQAQAEAGDSAPFLRMKQAVAAFYLDLIVPEAAGLQAAATARAQPYSALTSEDLLL
ncbi:acyl-CoA dehydrogenase [Sphingobium sp.]|uniref:acyl-CoA dehydrogenase n=1 Tax=Sphingobium sp. TaxID=1912891 RepID=UPI003BB6BF4B